MEVRGTFGPEDLSLLRRIHEQRNRTWTPEHARLSQQTEVLYREIDNFIRQRLNTEFTTLFPNESSQTARIEKIKRLLFDNPNDQAREVINNLSPESKRSYETFKTRFDSLQRAWTEANRNNRELYGQTYDYFSSVGDQFRSAVNQSRLDPASVANPHPPNIRVLAAVSQNAGSLPGSPNQASLHTRWLTEAIRSTSSMDEAINQMGRNIHVTGQNLDIEPQLQTPIASRRSNLNAWRKQDNSNPNVRRIAMIIAADDGSGDTARDVEQLRSNYFIGTAEQYKNDNNSQRHNQYRVDRLIVVRPPTSEETARGVTLRDKIRQAFQEAENFVNEERRRSGNNLIFEGVAHWLGHGTTVDKTRPNSQDERFYREGSMDFRFITNHDRQEGIDEDEIKRFERNNLRHFSYFIQDFNCCNSGAAIE